MKSAIRLFVTIYILALCVSACTTSDESPSTFSSTTSISEVKSLEESVDCWLKENGTALNESYGNGQCTAIARLLTDAPGYGKDSNGQAYGGYDYIQMKETNGLVFPLLSEAKDRVQACNNMVLFGKAGGYSFASVGHTVVVVNIDTGNDRIDWLDQNYAGKGLTLRSAKISEIKKNAYVIFASCKNGYRFQSEKCQSSSSELPEKEDSGLYVTRKAPTDTAVPVTPKKTIIIAGWTLYYDPEEWRLEPEPEEWRKENDQLSNKLVGSDCILSENIGRGTPHKWGKRIDKPRLIGGYEVGTETFKYNGETMLITYIHPDQNARISLNLHSMTGISKKCQQEVEKLIWESLDQEQ